MNNALNKASFSDKGDDASAYGKPSCGRLTGIAVI
jgi:hypothetical protein